MNLTHVLLTTDLSKEALRPFEPVLGLAKSVGARVTVLCVVEDLPIAPRGAPLAPPLSSPDLPQRLAEARKALEQQCSALGPDTSVSLEVISHESPARGIVEFAEQHDVDLIALSTHGRTGFKRLALGSVAENVLRHSPIPVLCFHRPEAD